MNTEKLYEKYKSTSLDKIQNYLKHIKIVTMMNDEYFPINENGMSKIIKDPRGISFTFGNFETEENNLELTVYKIIPFLVKSSSRFFLKPDIGEVFDQIDDNDINQISAIYVETENYKTIPNTEGEHFLLEATLLTNLKKTRKLKLKKIDKNS